MKLILTALITILLSACATNDKDRGIGGVVVGAIGGFAALLEPRGTRMFVDAKNYPPENFAAYGIVAFNSRAPKKAYSNYFRYSLFCEAYVDTIPHRSELKIPTSEQMVTVWPVESPKTASILNSADRTEVCDVAIQNYDLTTSLIALSQASAAGAKVDGHGPYLLAWSPATDKGKKDVFVLVKDMSLVSTMEEATNVFIRWRKDIESDPHVWKSGWNLEKAKSDIRQFVDLYGPRIAEFLE